MESGFWLVFALAVCCKTGARTSLPPTTSLITSFTNDSFSRMDVTQDIFSGITNTADSMTLNKPRSTASAYTATVAPANLIPASTRIKDDPKELSITHASPTTTAPDPATAVGPTTAPDPTTTEDPTTAHDPTTTEDPTTAHDPTTTEDPTTAHDPTTTEDPTTAHDPTTTEDPTTAHDPTTTVGPTTAHDPTTTEDPTTAPDRKTTLGPTTSLDLTTTVGPTSSPDPTPTVGHITGYDPTPTVGPTTAPEPSPTVGPTSIPDHTTTEVLTTARDLITTVGPTTSPDHTTVVGPNTGPDPTSTMGPTTAHDFTTAVGPTTSTNHTTTVGPTNSTDHNTTLQLYNSTDPDTNTTIGTTSIPDNTTTVVSTTAPDLTTTVGRPPTAPDRTTTVGFISPATLPPNPTTKIPFTTAPPVVCENDGVNMNGVCICPDEWAGATCSQENFCREGTVGEFSFPRTAVGWFAYSKEICPEAANAAGKPRASVRCVVRNGSPGFHDPPQVLQCDQSLSDLQQNLTSPADLETLASSTQILTSRPEELTAENVTTAAQIVNTLLLSPNATESVRVAAVATVSQLLSAEAPDNEEENESTLSLTQTLDQLSLNLSLSSNTSQSQVVQPNLVVQSTQVPAANTQGVQFTSLSGTSGSFVADRIQLNTNTSTPVVENGFLVDSMIYIKFPPEVLDSRQTPSNISLGFLLYQNDRFFRSRLYRRQRAIIRVLSASVRGQKHRIVPLQVEMRFRPKMVEGTSLYDYACVFWDYVVNDWNTTGCWKGNAADGVLQCFCNHTTNFAALWSFREDYEYAEALSVISIIGLSVSLLGLVVTIIHHLRETLFTDCSWPLIIRKSKVSLLCVCISLLISIITFLSGVQNSSSPSNIQLDPQTNTILGSDEHVEPDVGTCTAVAALLHYFLMATFMWNGVLGTERVLWSQGIHSLPSYWTRGSLAVGWGIPAVFMAVSLGATYSFEEPQRYRQEEFCWLAALDKNKEFHFGRPMFWGFLLPEGLILIYDLIMMVLFPLKNCKNNPQIKITRSEYLKEVLANLSITVMLGLSWTLGYLVLITSGHIHLVFNILFCISTSTQGLQIFILYTANQTSFRDHVSRSVQQIQFKLQNIKHNLTRDSSRSTESMSGSY